MLPKVVKDEILRLAWVIDAPQDILPRFEKSTYDGLYVDSDDQLNLILIEQERGHAQIVNSTRNIQEFLFWIFKEVTSSMAIQDISKYHLLPQDHVKTTIQKQIELLNLLNSDWALKVSREYKQYKEKYPDLGEQTS